MNTLLNWDTLVFQFLNGLHATWLDGFFYVVSQMVTWIPLYIILIIFLIKKQGKRAWIIIPLMLITITCVDQSCNVIKNTVQRPRPSHTEALATTIHLHQNNDGTYYYGGAYGFPSAHAANSMAFAIMIIFFLTKNKKGLSVAMILWALLLAYSRIYLGVHFPLDILTGLILGGCWSTFWIWIHNKFLVKIFSKESMDNRKIV